jgi:hypothetical protein
MNPGVMAVILLAVSASAQTAANSPGTNAQQAKADQTITGAVSTYTNPELRLTFAYPAELKPLAASSVAVEGRRMIYGEDTTSDSDSNKLGTCSTPLLAVGAGSAAGSSTGAAASIALFELDARCVPAKALKNQKTMDPLLRNLIRQAVTFLGMAPIEDPTYYMIQDHRVYFDSAQGTPVTRSDVQPSGSELTAAVATWLNGRVLCWMLEADSLEEFNRLLASLVDFGAGKPQALYPRGFAASAGGPGGR